VTDNSATEFPQEK